MKNVIMKGTSFLQDTSSHDKIARWRKSIQTSREVWCDIIITYAVSFIKLSDTVKN